MNRANKKNLKGARINYRKENINTKCWEKNWKPKRKKKMKHLHFCSFLCYIFVFPLNFLFYYLFYSLFLICLGLVQFALALFYLQWHQPLALQMTHQLSTTKVILNLMVTPLILAGRGILIKTRTREQLKE